MPVSFIKMPGLRPTSVYSHDGEHPRRQMSLLLDYPVADLDGSSLASTWPRLPTNVGTQGMNH